MEISSRKQSGDQQLSPDVPFSRKRLTAPTDLFTAYAVKIWGGQHPGKNSRPISLGLQIITSLSKQSQPSD